MPINKLKGIPSVKKPHRILSYCLLLLCSVVELFRISVSRTNIAPEKNLELYCQVIHTSQWIWLSRFFWGHKQAKCYASPSSFFRPLNPFFLLHGLLHKYFRKWFIHNKIISINWYFPAVEPDIFCFVLFLCVCVR